ncbi:hypothetical protein L596_028148 [Steinernema carpocapsae]|uniref:Uncharacterized protein n=1 Tax=Steinernema carpocapsae TaxID=34508 RepID=A0A4U5LXN6_STECR|nr:hypothetical protein L596_028148 [Steinernema carpocapsae]
MTRYGPRIKTRQLGGASVLLSQNIPNAAPIGIRRWDRSCASPDAVGVVLCNVKQLSEKNVLRSKLFDRLKSILQIQIHGSDSPLDPSARLQLS